jgi:transcriptional regulator with XRE-family HTH domain
VNVLADFAAHDARAAFVATVRAVMKERGVTQVRLAAAIGLSIKQVNRILRAVSEPGLGHMAAIARALDLELTVGLVPRRRRAQGAGRWA